MNPIIRLGRPTAADVPQMQGVRSRIRVADVDVLQRDFRAMLGG
jgi:hypothetical protein